VVLRRRKNAKPGKSRAEDRHRSGLGYRAAGVPLTNSNAFAPVSPLRRGSINVAQTYLKAFADALTGKDPKKGGKILAYSKRDLKHFTPLSVAISAKDSNPQYLLPPDLQKTIVAQLMCS
jgi:hypothetical protein